MGGSAPVNIGGLGLSPEQAEQQVLHLQRKLHEWATTDEQKRFCDLWNLVCHPATLLVAWGRVRSNQGSRTAGIDGVTRYDVEHRYGAERFLDEIRSSLKDRTFRPLPVRERCIPKKGGKVRRLGINTLRDRVVQAALKLVLEPIFESQFYPSSYGYRPGRRAQDAIAEIVHLGNTNYEWVIEGDVEACFDEIDRGALCLEIERRVGDRRVMALTRAFLKAGVMTEAGRLERRLTGTPQGGILSPLMANVALSVLDQEFEQRWAEMSTYRSRRSYLRSRGLATYRLIRFADDFVIMVNGPKAQAEVLMGELPEILDRIGLRLSPTKSRLTHLDQGFQFLGFTLRRKPRAGRKPCVYTFVSNEALASVKRKVKALTSRKMVNLSLPELLRKLNPILRGWTNYFRFAAAKRTLSYLRHYVWWRVVRWLRKKHPGRTWNWLWRRYQLSGQPQEAGQVLYNPGQVPIVRYLFRGSKIATPWNEVESKTPGKRDYDERKFLGRLQESLVG
jgi:RNA-directed DNA polymerase